MRLRDGVGKMTASGFRMEVRGAVPMSGRFQTGIRYPGPRPADAEEVMILSQYVSGYLYQCVVVERAIDLFVIFLAAPIPIFPRLTVNPPRVHHAARRTCHIGHGLSAPSTLLPGQRAEIPAVA